MHGVKDVLRDAESLPVEERIVIIDSLLRSINHTCLEVDQEWIKVAKSRLAEIREGKVKTIPGEEVFAKIRERFKK
ncbi:MAG: addiction module protein [Candidatus Rifleibacteriota bacterium]